MKQVGLYEAKSKLSALVSALIESGDSVSLTRHGKIVAEIRPPSSRSPRRGCVPTQNYFLSPDFDERSSASLPTDRSDLDGETD